MQSGEEGEKRKMEVRGSGRRYVAREGEMGREGKKTNGRIKV